MKTRAVIAGIAGGAGAALIWRFTLHHATGNPISWIAGGAAGVLINFLMGNSKEKG